MANCFMIADHNKCIGCRTCEIACVVAHSEENIFNSKASEIEFFPRLNVVKTKEVSAPIQCRQCEDAPCAKVCPVKAIEAKDGMIKIKKEECIGCKTCAIACPFGAIDMVTEFRDGKKVFQANLIKENSEEKEKIVAHKCDLCEGRDGGPACAEVCPTKALKKINMEQMEKVLRERRLKSAIDVSKIE